MLSLKSRKPEACAYGGGGVLMTYGHQRRVSHQRRIRDKAIRQVFAYPSLVSCFSRMMNYTSCYYTQVMTLASLAPNRLVHVFYLGIPGRQVFTGASGCMVVLGTLVPRQYGVNTVLSS